LKKSSIKTKQKQKMGDENWGDEASKPAAAAAVGGEGDAPKTGFGVRIIIVIIFNRIDLIFYQSNLKGDFKII
jgi:hypothetical protein